MGSRKQKLAQRAEEINELIPTQQVPLKLQLPYHGPDRLTKLPEETKLRICAFLHTDGEAKWDDKSHLKALHLAHPKFHDVVREELFRYMSIEFSYHATFDKNLYERTGGQEVVYTWPTPKLLQLIGNGTDVMKHVRAVRISAVPVRQSMRSETPHHSQYLDTGPRPFLPLKDNLSRAEFLGAEAESRAIASKTSGSHELIGPYGYVHGATSLPKTTVQSLNSHHPIVNPQARHCDDLFRHLFTRDIERDFGRHVMDQTGDSVSFGFYLLDNVRRTIANLPNLKHLEAGMVPSDLPEFWTKEDFLFIREWGLLMSTAVILKAGTYTRLSSLGLWGLPSTSKQIRGHWSEWLCFSIRQVVARVEHFGTNLTNLDLEVDNSRDPIVGGLPLLSDGTWPMGPVFWAGMLNRLQNLRSLRLMDVGYRYEDRDTEQFYLDEMLPLVQIVSLRALHLIGWSVTPEIMTEKLPASFANIRVLDLEYLELNSDENEAWHVVFAALKERYRESEIGTLIGLRTRRIHGKDVGYVKSKLKVQLGTERVLRDLWNQVARKETEQNSAEVEEEGDEGQRDG